MPLKYDLYSSVNQRIIDGLIAGAAFFLAYQLRFEADVPAVSSYQLWLLLPLLILGRILVNWYFGIYFLVWRYINIRDAVRVTSACATFSLVLLAVRLAAPDSIQILRVPLSIIAIEFLITSMGQMSARSIRRLFYEHGRRNGFDTQVGRRLLLLGAGSAGIMVAKEALLRPEVEVVGFLDDDPQKIGTVINGVRVLGAMDDLQRVVLDKSPDEVVICIASGTGAVYRKILRLCDGLSIRTKVVPSVSEILEGNVGITSFREVSMHELLGRETIVSPGVKERVWGYYAGRRILVAGAGGSIGSELVRQLAEFEPKTILLLDKDENGLFELRKSLDDLNFSGTLELLVADLRFKSQLTNILALHQPEIIFHAAAHKHVPMMEVNAAEAVFNNIFGTKNLFELATGFGVERLVFISSDKAVAPTNIMGATKRIGELMAQRNGGGTHFSCVRFGNVLDSRGSVVPIFREQIARGGPITITNPEMRRYFMTIPEAVHLILMAGQMEECGSLFVLDMGNPRSVVELARELVEINGLRLGQDIQMVVTGTRPGEKLTESLCSRYETLVRTSYERILRVESPRPPREQLEACLEKLWDAVTAGDELAIRLAFCEVGIWLPAGPTPRTIPQPDPVPLYQTR